MLNILTGAQCSLKLCRQHLLWSGSNSNCIGRKRDIQMMNVTQCIWFFFHPASNASRVLFNASNISQDVDCIQSRKSVSFDVDRGDQFISQLFIVCPLQNSRNPFCWLYFHVLKWYFLSIEHGIFEKKHRDGLTVTSN